jgi:PmbA protein
MIGKEKAQEILGRVLDLAGDGAVEGLLSSRLTSVTRFANSAITQNVDTDESMLQVRVALGQKVGRATTNALDDAGLRKVVETARELARLSSDDAEFPGFPAAPAAEPLDAFVAATANCTPHDRSEMVKQSVAVTRAHDVEAYGVIETGTRELAIANSSGVDAYHQDTVATMHVVAVKEEGISSRNFAARDVSAIDPAALAQRAAERCLASREPILLPPGRYDVILEEEAVKDILMHLGALAFGALSLQENRSFIAGKLGTRVLGSNVTLWDDGTDPRTFGFPFDMEGVPKQKVVLVNGGVAENVVYDARTAEKEGRRSTGHAIPPIWYASGPMPIHMFMAGGEATREQLIAGTERGLLINRFHYSRPIDPSTAVVTGITREGTFLIENGRIVAGVKNLRYIQSYPEALCNVGGLTRDTKLQTEYEFNATVPAIKVRGFNVTGSSGD